MKHHSPTPLSAIEKASFAYPKPKKIVKIKKVLKRVGDRKKRRIAKYGTETELFERIWKTRSHICEECLEYLPEYSHYLFHHIKPK